MFISGGKTVLQSWFLQKRDVFKFDALGSKRRNLLKETKLSSVPMPNLNYQLFQIDVSNMFKKRHIPEGILPVKSPGGLLNQRLP